jgi:hypothetical protein
MLYVYLASGILTTSLTGRRTLKEKKLRQKNVKCVIQPLSKRVLPGMEQLTAGAKGAFTYADNFVKDFIR